MRYYQQLRQDKCPITKLGISPTLPGRSAGTDAVCQKQVSGTMWKVPNPSQMPHRMSAKTGSPSCPCFPTPESICRPHTWNNWPWFLSSHVSKLEFQGSISHVCYHTCSVSECFPNICHFGKKWHIDSIVTTILHQQLIIWDLISGRMLWKARLIWC